MILQASYFLTYSMQSLLCFPATLLHFQVCKPLLLLCFHGGETPPERVAPFAGGGTESPQRWD